MYSGPMWCLADAWSDSSEDSLSASGLARYGSHFLCSILQTDARSFTGILGMRKMGIKHTRSSVADGVIHIMVAKVPKRCV